jgi:hypothetical protein
VSQSALLYIYSKLVWIFFSFKLDCVNITREIKPRADYESRPETQRGRKLSIVKCS